MALIEIPVDAPQPELRDRESFFPSLSRKSYIDPACVCACVLKPGVSGGRVTPRFFLLCIIKAAITFQMSLHLRRITKKHTLKERQVKHTVDVIFINEQFNNKIVVDMEKSYYINSQYTVHVSFPL